MKLHNIIKRTDEIIAGSSEAFVGTLCDDGYPHVSQRSLIRPENLKELWFSGGREGNLYKRLKADGRTSLSFYDEKNNVTLIGRTEEITDRAIKKERWLDWFINHYPDGPEGDEFILFRFTTERVSLWVDQTSYLGDITEITSPVSYCGLLCGTCDFRESHNCAGCHALEGKPFWGECPLATCARSRNLYHCGQCPDMPCDALKDFSCGDGDHCDNPKEARLDILKLW